EIHRARRKELSHQIRIRYADPVAALPAYAIPFDVDGPDAARELAGLLEQRLAVLYADLVAATRIPALREYSAGVLVDTAVLATRWPGSTTALPGLDGVPKPATWSPSRPVSGTPRWRRSGQRGPSSARRFRP